MIYQHWSILKSRNDWLHDLKELYLINARRTKLKQTEVDCEYLKRCCENLTEENRRLQKEVNELRTLKLSPQSYMNMNPPTTLTMCPSCERVAVRPPPSSAPASTAPPATSSNGIAGHLKPLGPQHQRSYAHNPGPWIGLTLPASIVLVFQGWGYFGHWKWLWRLGHDSFIFNVWIKIIFSFAFEKWYAKSEDRNRLAYHMRIALI